MDYSKYLCAVGVHRYKVVDLTNCFYTEYNNTNWGPIKHMVYYQQCRHCKKRSFKTTHKKDTMNDTHHSGIEFAKIGWLEYGIMYLGDGEIRRTLQPQPPTKPGKLRVVKGGKQ